MLNYFVSTGKLRSQRMVSERERESCCVEHG